MMKKTDSRKSHGNAVFIACVDDVIITDRTAGLCYIFYATLMCAFDVITEWEKCVTAKSYACVFCYPCLFLFHREWLWLFCEEVLPCTITQHIFIFVTYIYIDNIVAIGTTDSRFERKCHDFWILTKPPYVCLVTSQTCAVDATLLTCTDADCLTVFYIAYTIDLRVFQSDERYDEVAFSFWCECL